MLHSALMQRQPLVRAACPVSHALTRVCLSPFLLLFPLLATLTCSPQRRSPAAMQQLQGSGGDCVVHLDSILNYFALFRPFWMTCVILVGYLGVLHVMTFIGQLHLTKKERR